MPGYYEFGTFPAASYDNWKTTDPRDYDEQPVDDDYEAWYEVWEEEWTEWAEAMFLRLPDEDAPAIHTPPKTA